jgi:hypothetical protein
MPGPKYVKQFEFPSSFGFTGSAHDREVTTVRSHDRRKPQRFAKGGVVRKGSAGVNEMTFSEKNPKTRRGPAMSREKISQAVRSMGGGALTETEARRLMEARPKVAHAKGGSIKRVSRSGMTAKQKLAAAGIGAAAGAGLAALGSRDDEGKTADRRRMSTLDVMRGKSRRQQMQDLGLKKGGKVHKGMKNC